MSEIPLLSPKRLREFDQIEFFDWVKSLYAKKTPRSSIKIKRQRDLAVSAKVTKTGKLSITTKRKPKYITEEEIKQIKKETGRGENEIFIEIKRKEIIRASHEEAEEIRRRVAEIPF